MKTYRIIDIFGNEEIINITPSNKSKTLFADYDGFVEKFNHKKTTDDCYTPPDIYNCILNYVDSIYPLKNKQILRPFYPGGDFEIIEYSQDSIVVDNPPFSIISKICKFYLDKNIKFFLFAPHLTLFSSDLKCTAIVCGFDIIYENGATIKTSFLTNLLGDNRVVGDHQLYQELKKIQKKQSANLPKYNYPVNILTVSMVQAIIEKGISLKISIKDTIHVRQLDCQKKYKKSIFGSAFLLSHSAAAEKAAAEKAAAEKAAAEKAADSQVIIWELSEREKNIINSMKNNG